MKRFFALISFAVIAAMLTTAAFAEEAKKGGKGPRKGPAVQKEWKDIVIADVKNEKFAEALKKADADGDGIVTKAEMDAAMKARFEEMKANKPEWKDIVIADVKNEKFAEALKKADADGDGIVTEEEMKAAMKARFEEMKAKKPEAKPEGKKDRKKGDFKKGEGKKKGEGDKSEGKKGKKGEGKKSDAKKGEKKEWKDIVIADEKNEKRVEFLKKADTDNDGIVTLEEMKAARKAAKPEGKPEGKKGDFKKGEGKKKGEGEKKECDKPKKECDKSKNADGEKKAHKKGDHKKGEGKKKGEGDKPEAKKRERQPREWKDIVIADVKEAPKFFKGTLEEFIDGLKKADTDGDGIVTQEEMKAARPARPAAAEGEAKKGPRKGDFKKGEGKKKGDEAAEKSEGKKHEHKKGDCKGKKGDGKKGEHKKGEGKGKGKKEKKEAAE